MYVLKIAARREVVEKLFLVKFQTFHFQALTFQGILPQIVETNSLARHFPGSIIKKGLQNQPNILPHKWF